MSVLTHDQEEKMRLEQQVKNAIATVEWLQRLDGEGFSVIGRLRSELAGLLEAPSGSRRMIAARFLPRLPTGYHDAVDPYTLDELHACLLEEKSILHTVMYSDGE